jgi:glyoxylase-like metal-dependent hydrolase (beta-lactamase superfamily II)
VTFERVNDRVARIAIPLTFFSVPVNVHVVLAERPLLVDCGPRTEDARALLVAGLANLELHLRDVSDVIVTHHHIDHGGLLSELVEHGARGWAHEDDLESVLDVSHSITQRIDDYRTLGESWGFSDELGAKVYRHLEYFLDLGGLTPRDKVSAIAGESVDLAIPGTSLRAIHVPGHSEGQIVLHERDANILFSADHVLERVTPNPQVYVPPYRGRTTGLEDYVASLEALRFLPRDILVCPGHGPPFRGLHERIDAILRHHAERAEAILVLVEKKSKATVLDLARDVWPSLATRDVTLACREVHGHLEMLEKRGLVRRELEGKKLLFERTA